MKKKHNIIKGDKVLIITGNDKGKIGEVLEVHKSQDFIKISHVRLQTHFDKKDNGNGGGLNTREGWVHISNATHICSDNKPTKIKRVRTDKGVKIFSRRTSEELRTNKNTKVEVSPTQQTPQQLQKEKAALLTEKDAPFQENNKKKKGDK